MRYVMHGQDARAQRVEHQEKRSSQYSDRLTGVASGAEAPSSEEARGTDIFETPRPSCALLPSRPAMLHGNRTPAKANPCNLLLLSHRVLRPGAFPPRRRIGGH